MIFSPLFHLIFYLRSYFYSADVYGNIGTEGNYIVTPRLENANKSGNTKGGDHTGKFERKLFLSKWGGKNILLTSNYSFSA